MPIHFVAAAFLIFFFENIFIISFRFYFHRPLVYVFYDLHVLSIGISNIFAVFSWSIVLNGILFIRHTNKLWNKNYNENKRIFHI